MKRVFLGFLVSFALLIMFNVEGFGQGCSSCPTNYSPVSYTVGFPDNPTCQVTFYLCTFCPPTGSPQVKFCSAEFSLSDCYGVTINPVTWLELKKSVMGLVLDDCEFTEIPPCSTMSYQAVDYYEADCLIGVQYSNGNVGFEPCPNDPGVCKIEFTACMEDDVIIVDVLSGPTAIDNGNCGPAVINLGPQIPLPPGCFTLCE